MQSCINMNKCHFCVLYSADGLLGWKGGTPAVSAVLSDLHQHILTMCDIVFRASAGNQDYISFKQECSAETTLWRLLGEGDAPGIILRGRGSKSTPFIMLAASE